MARARIRTKSGRLTAGERRRRLAATGLQPGEVIILDRNRRVTKGVRSTNSMLVEFRVDSQLAIDSDVRKLLHEIRVNLAEHYRQQLLSGERASGSGDLPELKETTIARNPNRPKSFGVLSGEMARKWLLLKITGGPLAAQTRIKPNGADGRSFTINRWLAKGIDLQSIDGAAAEVIRVAIARFVNKAVSDTQGIATPPNPNTTEGDLTTIRP